MLAVMNPHLQPPGPAQRAAARDRGRNRLRAVTAAVGLASVLTVAGVAVALPGATAASARQPAEQGSSRAGTSSSGSGSGASSGGQSSDGTSSAGSSGSASSGSGLKSASAPSASSGSGQVTSGGS
jgi:hypothetical protein